MILDQLGISEEKFEEYLEELIDNNSVDEALKMSGLLPPFTSSIQVEPIITKVDKNIFTRVEYTGVKQLKIQDTHSTRNHVVNSFKMKKVDEIDMKDSLPNHHQDSSIASAA